MGVAPLKSNLLEMFFQFLLGFMFFEGNFLKLIRGKYADSLSGLFEIFYFPTGVINENCGQIPFLSLWSEVATPFMKVW